MFVFSPSAAQQAIDWCIRNNTASSSRDRGELLVVFPYKWSNERHQSESKKLKEKKRLIEPSTEYIKNVIVLWCLKFANSTRKWLRRTSNIIHLPNTDSRWGAVFFSSWVKQVFMLLQIFDAVINQVLVAQRLKKRIWESRLFERFKFDELSRSQSSRICCYTICGPENLII